MASDASGPGKFNETCFSRVLDRLGSRPATELPQNVGATRLGCSKACAAQARDFRVGVAERKQSQYLLLLRREYGHRVRRPMHTRDLNDHCGLQIGLTASDGANARDQLGRRGRLQQVAVCTGRERGSYLGGISRPRENQDRALGKTHAKPGDNVAMSCVRHIDVRDNDIGCDVGSSGVAHSGRLCYNDEIGLLLDHRAQTLSAHGAAIDEH
jgi:hypothetical protein